MSTEAPAPDVNAVLAALELERAALDPVAAETAARATANAIATAASDLDNRILVIRQSSLTIRACDGKIAAEAKWRDTLSTIRAQLCTEQLALPPRIRDAKTLGMLTNLRLSIGSIDSGLQVDRYALNALRLGQLLIEAGYQPAAPIENQIYGEGQWFGSMHEVDVRSQKLLAERAEAEARVADALMSNEQRAEAQAAIQATNAAAGQLKTRGDGSRYRKFPDGTIAEVEV